MGFEGASALAPFFRGQCPCARLPLAAFAAGRDGGGIPTKHYSRIDLDRKAYAACFNAECLIDDRGYRSIRRRPLLKVLDSPTSGSLARSRWSIACTGPATTIRHLPASPGLCLLKLLQRECDIFPCRLLSATALGARYGVSDSSDQSADRDSDTNELTRSIRWKERQRSKPPFIWWYRDHRTNNER
jgi:hypothetical protein